MHRHYRKIVKASGLPYIRFHNLRHTHATLMLQQGIHPKVVSERLTHSTIGITMVTHTHVLPNMQKKLLTILSNLLSKLLFKIICCDQNVTQKDFSPSNGQKSPF
jgi:integrase